MPKKETILFIGAHSDDHVLGGGGTIAKYTEEGQRVISIVLSYGEKTHPWLKSKVAKDMRYKEAIKAGKVLGCSTIFFDLKETKFLKDFKKIKNQLLTLLKLQRPKKIFTHSNEDPHPDHQATFKILTELLEEIDFAPEVYIYSIWNPFSFKKSDKPKLYVNISKYFTTKIKALKCFHSQRFNAIYPLLLGIYINAIKNALQTKGYYAEKFFKLK